MTGNSKPTDDMVWTPPTLDDVIGESDRTTKAVHGVTRAQVLEALLPHFERGWGYGISCDDGWNQIILDLHNELVKFDPEYKIHQIKEKFGGLRYYAAVRAAGSWNDPDSDATKVFELERAAEALSYDTCETCGKHEDNPYTGVPRPDLYLDVTDEGLRAENPNYDQLRDQYQKEREAWLATRDIRSEGSWIRTLCRQCRTELDEYRAALGR